MGTPNFALPALRALMASEHELVAVYTAPPRPANRGKKVSRSAVHLLAEEACLPIFTPSSLRGAEAQAEFASLNCDIAVVVAYGLLLPQAILDTPKFGCLNIHPSDLPRWRGAAPIQRTIMAGDATTAICIMQMDSGLDTGAVWKRLELAIPQAITAQELEVELAEKSADLLLEVLAKIEDLEKAGELEKSGAGGDSPIPQAQNGVTYAHKIEKSEYLLRFDMPAQSVLNHINALSPYGYVMIGEERVRIVKAELVVGSAANVTARSATARAGEFINSQFHIQCEGGQCGSGRGSGQCEGERSATAGGAIVTNEDLAIKAVHFEGIARQDSHLTAIAPIIVQREGKKPVHITDFLNGLRA